MCFSIIKIQTSNLCKLAILYSIIIFISLNSKIYAGSGDIHIDHWNKVMGVINIGKNHKLNSSWKIFQDAIDDKRGFPFYTKLGKILKQETKDVNIEECPNSSKESPHTRRCGHRTYFHWGFHAKPRMIENTIKKCIKCWNSLSTEKKDRILEIIKTENIRRNKSMIRAVSKATHLSRTRASPLAAILYDVHILVDWQDRITLPLAELNYLRKELDKAIVKLSKEPEITYKMGKELRQKLKKSSYVPGDRNKAKNMLIILEESLPELLWEKYGNIFPFERN